MAEHIVIGTRELWGQEVPFSLLHHDRRHHLYTIGKSGSGKTTLLRNLILQDIEAGHGVAVIDPHGDLANDLLDHLPRHRIEDVAYFNPADMEHPVGFNLLGATPPDERHLVASGVVGVFKTIWPEFWGPRLEYILYAAVAALLDCENVTLLGVQRMLSDVRYRAWVVKQVKDPMVRSFWVNEFEHYDKKFLHEAISEIPGGKPGPARPPVLGKVWGRIATDGCPDEGESGARRRPRKEKSAPVFAGNSCAIVAQTVCPVQTRLWARERFAPAAPLVQPVQNS